VFRFIIEILFVRPCVRASDATVPRFNSPAEPARTVGSENGIRPGQSDSANGIPKTGKRDSAPSGNGKITGFRKRKTGFGKTDATVPRFNSPAELGTGFGKTGGRTGQGPGRGQGGRVGVSVCFEGKGEGRGGKGRGQIKSKR